MRRMIQSWGLLALACVAFSGFWYPALSASLPVSQVIEQAPVEQAARCTTHECREDAATETVALYTKVLAWFTVVLAFASIGQGVLLARQIRLGRDEFIATHRPRLFVQRVSITHGRDDRDYQIPARCVVYVVNGGEAQCWITEWEAVIYYQGDNAMFVPGEGKITVYNRQDKRVLIPGQSGRLEFEQAADALGISEFNVGNAILFVIGRITYEGDDRIPRVTGFCREYNRNTGRWSADKSTEYEYAY